MGTWDASLYGADEAGDLKNAIVSLCKVPADGESLLGTLIEMHPRSRSTDEGSTIFWLVVADQFERRGIVCARAAAEALSIIAAGTDLAEAREKGADDDFLKKRAKVLNDLAHRLRNPRPPRSRKFPKKPPDLVLGTGQIYSYPAMKDQGLHPYWVDRLYGAFQPDGWGALAVLATGRAFDWLPWCALAALDVDGSERPTLQDALRAKLIFHPQTDGAGRFVPRKAHARTLGLELLGTVSLDTARVEPLLSRWPVAQAIQYDWTIAYAARGKHQGTLSDCVLSSLLI